jgi:hypothetical protein
MEVVVKDLLPGTKYILQARSKGANGVTSQWSNTFKVTTESDTIAPSPVTALSWLVNRNAFIGTWTKPTTDSNGNPLKDFNGYEITITGNSISKKFISMQERFDLSFEQNVASFGAPQPVVQISVKTRDIVGNLSTAVTATATNAVPADLTGIAATGIPGAIFLDWDDTLENDFSRYEIYSSTSSGFTPGPTNLIATAYGSQFSYPVSDVIPHYFKVRQLDVFNQASGYSSVTGTALTTTGIDTTPPNAPSAIVVTSASDSAGLAHIDVSWTASSSTNLGGYVVRYSTDEITWRYISVPSDSTQTTISNLTPNVAYYVSVASVSYVSSYSAWIHAGTYPITTARDTTAPSTPSIPTVSFNTQIVQVSHAMTKSGGGNLEADVRYLEVHASTTTGFTASSSTLIGTLDAAGQGITVVGNFPVPVTDSVSNMYWRVIAVDYAGNKSVQSFQATGLPDLIQGSNISNATITDAKIGSLSAAKLVAGTAFVNNLSIQSQLTIDAVAGSIQSSNYSVPSKTGYKLDQSGLTIYDGSIAAKSLLLQNGNNIAQPAFADFEFNESFYHDTANNPSATTLTATSGMLLAMQYTGVKTGKQSLRAWNTAITGATLHKLHFGLGGDSATGVNIDVNPGDYIVSIWAKKNGAVDQTLKLGLYPDTGAAIESTGISVTSTSWTRYSAVLTVPSGVSKVKQYISLQAVTTGYDIVIDALQMEPKLTAETTPSAWKPPSTTVIDGGSIITGSIRSSAASATVPGQPAWSINTAGNMQIGDALVRGRLTMGVASDARNLVPNAYASFENTASFYYNTSTNVPNAANIGVFGANASALRMQQDTTGTPPYGSYGMRMYQLSGATAASSRWVYLAVNNNITLVPGQQYIISFYAKNNDATKATTLEIGMWNSVNTNVPVITSQAITTSYARYSAVFTAPATAATQVYVGINTGASDTAFDITIDAIQLEAAQVGSSTPTAFTDGANGVSSMVSANYSAGVQGWTINSDGTAEFNNTTIRGGIQITGAGGQIKTDLASTTPTIFFYGTNGAAGQYSFINAVGSTSPKIGINSCQYAATTGGHIMRPRLYMPAEIRIEHVDETAGINAGKYQGGQVILDQTSASINTYDSTNLARTTAIFENDGSWTFSTYASSGLFSSQIFNDVTGISLSHFLNGSFKSGVVFDDTKIRLSTLNGFYIEMSGTTGYITRNPDGTSWYSPTLTTPSGGTGPWLQRSGWTAFGCKITPDGMVVFRGSLVPNSVANAGDGKQICTLPAQFRPASNVICPVAVDATGGTGSARMWVQTNGAVLMYGVGNNAVGFDGAQYSLI